MTIKTTVIKTSVCDYQGADPAGWHPNARTIRFGIDGKEFEAEFCADDELGLALDLEPFIEAARPAVRRTPRTTAKRETRTPDSRRRAVAIRAWARERHLIDSDRGRIPASVAAKYEQAHGGSRG